MKKFYILLIVTILSPVILNAQDSINIRSNDSLESIDYFSKSIDEWLSDKSDNRMILAPTGRTIKQGQLQIASMVIIPFLAFPTAHVGITDYINVGFGFSVPFGLFYVAPKVRFLKTEYLSISGGLLWCPAKDNSPDFNSFSIGYIAASIGSQEASLNIGAGYNFTRGLFDKKPVVQIGGDLQVARGFKLISENWGIVGESVPVLSAGIRIFNDFINFDALAVFVPGSDFPLAFYPLVSMGLNFDLINKKK
jgi:hypothetical protein